MKHFITKHFKKLGFVVAVATMALALLTPTPATAQSPRSVRFLSDGVLTLTVTNGIPYTNLLSAGAAATNLVGLSFTNAFGSNIVVSATNNNTTKLTKDLQLWTDRSGNLTTNANISATCVAGSGNTTTNTLVFVPLYDGTNESTVAADALIMSITANGTTKTTSATINPAAKWPGALAIRCKAIADGTNAAASQFTILDLRLNGFPP